MTLKEFFTQFFTWWNGQTLNTRFHTWRHGERVGEDEFGNVYYRSKGGAKDPALGIERRWVIYAGLADLSRVPPGWRGWLAHTYPTAPSQEEYAPREWQKNGAENHTGTAQAYRPQGSILTPEQRPRATGDYAAWSPGD
jgi:NADH:ubiquinone oxidoreductase subunit